MGVWAVYGGGGVGMCTVHRLDGLFSRTGYHRGVPV